MNSNEPRREGFAAIWIVGINVLIACAAQVAATLALIQELAGTVAPR